MKKIIFSIILISFMVLLQGVQLSFAQENLTAKPNIAELEADPDTEIIRHPDGSIEIIRKVTFFEEIRIPKEIFVRESVGYTNPIIDDNYIASPHEISRDPAVIGANAFLSILIFLIVGLACFLFNNVIGSHGDGINKFTSKIPILNLFQGKNMHKGSIIKFLLLLVMLVLFGLIAAHITPDFNLFEQRNLGILVITVSAIIVATYSKDFLRFIIAKKWGWSAFFKPNVLGLLFAIVCVALSRKLEIPPGYLFGIPIGLFVFSKQFSKNEGKFEFFALFWMFLMAIGAWFIAPLTKDYEVIYDLFNLLYVILLEGVFFELIPLTYLPGKAIYKWSKIAWAILFSAVSFLLLHTLFNPNSTITTIKDSNPTKNTLIILGVFVLACFTIWGIARIRLAIKKT